MKTTIEWIPVKLDEDGKLCTTVPSESECDVLVCYKNYYIEIVRWDADVGFDVMYYEDLAAWAHLPAPYKDAKEEPSAR